MARSSWRRALGRALVGAQLVVTLLALQGAGMVAASTWQQRELAQAESDAQAARLAFDAATLRALAEGTPHALIEPLAAREAAVVAGRTPAATRPVDRTVVGAARGRAMALQALVHQVEAVETQVEVDLHQKLVDAVKALRADEPPAQAAGLDVSSWEGTATATETQAQALLTPDATQQLIDAVTARDAVLKQATSDALNAAQALADAKGNAQAQLARAQGALASARAIPILQVDGFAQQVGADAQRLQSAVTLADFQGLASDLATQTDAVDNLLYLRQGSYQILFTAQAHLQRAQQGGIDVGADVPRLADAGHAIDNAGTADALTTARDQVQGVKNDIDVKYNLALYGPGKVIVVSIQDQELEALQDGVVVLDTLITSGRPSLPSPVGTWSITAKFTPYHMISPWPPGNQYYYPPTWIKYAMLWHDGGYFIHDAPWRYHFGPGSDTEFGGTHGCINVPGASIGWLYDWTPVGTKVVTLAGEF